MNGRCQGNRLLDRSGIGCVHGYHPLSSASLSPIIIQHAVRLYGGPGVEKNRVTLGSYGHLFPERFGDREKVAAFEASVLGAPSR